ncbi:MAG: TspO/MBR family protein [Saprospiraceae bacterium]
MKNLVFTVAVCVFICMTFGLFSGFSTISSIAGWYTFIEKPSWNPPNWIFGPVWTGLYMLMGISLGIVWNRRKHDKSKAIKWFAIQFALNLLWSYIFFNLHFIGVALFEIILMLYSIGMMIRYFYKISPVAAYLQIPYFLWVSFATALNAAIWYLNEIV